jgi:hypothetical protein
MSMEGVYAGQKKCRIEFSHVRNLNQDIETHLGAGIA